MTEESGVAGLARLSGLLVRGHDPVGIITAGLIEVCRSVEAGAGGVLVRTPQDHLDVLTATSHRAGDLEAYQATADDGPCAESMRTGRPVPVEDLGSAVDRWPAFGERMRAAGFVQAFAVPMTWQGESVGGLNIFWTESRAIVDDERLLQTFADVLTLALLHVRPMSLEQATERLQDGLEARSGIEQAKGVLAWQHDVDMVEAYAALLRISVEADLTLGEAAAAVIESARRGESLGP